MQFYLGYLDSEGKMLSEKQIEMLLWEVIIETSDTTMVATEWAMYELAKDLKRQVGTSICVFKVKIYAWH